MRSLSWVIACAITLAACQSPAAVGTPCARASDCASPLVCTYGVCRSACASSRDCPIATRCLASAGGGVCALDVENHCDGRVCPTPLVCSSDVCRTTCTTGADCLSGACVAGSCDEPVSGADAGVLDGGEAANDGGMSAQDADVDAGIDAGGCMLVPSLLGAWAGGQFDLDTIALATSEQGTGAATVGTAYVGALGVREGATRSDAFVVVGPLGGAAPTSEIDLHDAFGVTQPLSIALSRRPDGAIGVAALFDHSDLPTGGNAFGAYGTIDPTTASPTITLGRLFCPESTCMVAGGMQAAGRVALAYRVESPFVVFRAQTVSGLYGLRALDVGTGIVSSDSTPLVPQPIPTAEITGGHGSLVVTFEPGDGASITPALASWDMNEVAAGLRDLGGGVGMAAPGARPAIAPIGSNRFALVYTDTDGGLVAYVASCAGGPCSVTPAHTGALIPSTMGSHVRVSATEIDGGFALAWVEIADTADVVHVATFATPSGSPFTQLGEAVVYATVDTSRRIGDVQIAAVHEGAALHLVVAMLDRPATLGLPGRLDKLIVADVTLANCP